MNTIKNRKGFTIIEILIAIIVLTVGVLAMVTTAALVTRMIARGQRSADASAFMARRVERIRAVASGQLTGACVAPVPGADTLFRGTNWVAINTWTVTPVVGQTQNFRVMVRSTYKTGANRFRTDSMETTFSCDPYL
jgi:prepilin-type N-terminal cleavage/methylation domain-containing protein